MTITEELDQLVNMAESIPEEKKYWLIRTQSGSLYDSFRQSHYVSLEHNEIGITEVKKFKSEFKDDPQRVLPAIKSRVTEIHTRLVKDLDEELNPRRVSLISNQIFKFIYEIKKGDTVIIPSYNSDLISFGTVTENDITGVNAEERRRTISNSVLQKRVKWNMDIPRIKLDPYLYKMFTAHQALNEVSDYADVIERSLNDFFILDDEAHIIINVQSEDEISAADLFGLGSEILRLVDGFALRYKLDVRSSELKVTISLNSPGKIDLKSKFKKTTLITGIILAVFGGGYQSGDTTLKTDGVPGLIKAVREFMNEEANANLRRDIYEKYKDSLNIKSPDDMVKLLKQFSDNKDIAK